MSRAVRVFKRIRKDFPALVLCKRMLVVPPTEHILRGFFLDATSTKDRVNLWRVVMPLCRPLNDVVLDYSKLLPEQGYLYVRKEAFEQSVREISILVGEHVRYLQGVRHPSDFLRHASWVGSESPIQLRFDQAMIHCRIGNVKHAVAVLHALDREAERLSEWEQQYIRPLAEARASRNRWGSRESDKVAGRMGERGRRATRVGAVTDTTS